jgi:hypothetical protein
MWEGALEGQRPSESTSHPSLRCPDDALSNGLWGFKPSSKRLPRGGIVGCIGPAAHSLRDLELLVRIVLSAEPWKRDVTLVPMPWRDVDARGVGAGCEGWSGEGGRLRVGIMWEDGVVRPVRPTRRALEGMADKLRDHPRVELVDFTPEFVAEIWKITVSTQAAASEASQTHHSQVQLYYIDGGKKLREALGEERMYPLTEWIVSQSRELSNDQITTVSAEAVYGPAFGSASLIDITAGQSPECPSTAISRPVPVPPPRRNTLSRESRSRSAIPHNSLLVLHLPLQLPRLASTGLPHRNTSDP